MALADIKSEERKKWDLRPGNTIKVWLKIKEGDKTRLQAFEGLIIAHKHGFEPGATFTVRKISKGIGVERIFPVFSPNIDKIEIVKRAKVKRAKLYYIREKAAKEIRRKMKQIRGVVQKGVSPLPEEKNKQTPVSQLSEGDLGESENKNPKEDAGNSSGDDNEKGKQEARVAESVDASA